MSFFKRFVLVLLAIVLPLSFSNMSASASPAFPTGAYLYGLDYGPGPYDQLFSINAATSLLTRVGTSRAGNIGPLSAAYDVVNNMGYYLQDSNTNTLVSMNLNTGTSAVLGNISGLGGNQARSIGITSTGNAFLITGSTNGVGAKLYSLNVSTRVATIVSSTGTDLLSDPASLVYNSTTSQLEVLTVFGDLYSVSNTGVFTLTASTPSRGYYIGGQVDANGVYWITDGNASTLVSLSRAGSVLTPSSVGATVDSNSNSVYVQAMFLVPAPVVATTTTTTTAPNTTSTTIAPTTTVIATTTSTVPATNRSVTTSLPETGNSLLHKVVLAIFLLLVGLLFTKSQQHRTKLFHG